MATAVEPIDYGLRLNQARAAYHDLMMGKAVSVYVDQNGERVEYKASTATKLAAYIADLERLTGLSTSGPMRVWM